MRIGVLLMPTDPWDETVARVRDLEEMGFAHLWVYDHVNWQRYRDRDWHSALPWLTGVAGVTQRIRLGTMVLNPNIRHPLTCAKEAITLDHISGGRLIAGIGAGGTGQDATILGAPVLSPGERIDRLAEFLTIFDGAMAGSLDTFTGTHFSTHEAAVHPRPVQEPRIPIAVAAGRPRALGLAARFGDAWITWGDTSRADLSPAGTERAVRKQAAILRERCDVEGRDYEHIDKIFLIGNSDDRPLQSIDAFVDFVGRYEEIGFTDIVFHHPRLDDAVWNEPFFIVEEIAAALLDARP